MEEVALRRRLEDLISHVSDQRASSEEEGEGDGAEPGGSTPVEHLPGAAQEVRLPERPRHSTLGGGARGQQFVPKPAAGPQLHTAPHRRLPRWPGSSWRSERSTFRVGRVSVRALRPPLLVVTCGASLS